MSDAQPRPCVTHRRTVVDCQWRFDWGLMSAAARAQCSDVNGPGWIPPTLTAAVTHGTCPTCGGLLSVRDIEVVTEPYDPATNEVSMTINARCDPCPRCPVTVEIIKVEETP